MKMQVLGCAGGIGGHARLTTCLWVDHDILLDAGTGLSSLALEQLTGINHVFITHGHLDHVAGLALLVDAIQGKRTGPVTVYATQPVIDALKQHLFNWVLWPDFTTIPNATNPTMRWQPIAPGVTIELEGRSITPFPVNHTTGSSAYWVRGRDQGFVFTGDMSATPQLWEILRHEPKLHQVIVDCSFTNADRELADKSMHFCPRTLIDEVASMPASVEFLIYHLKPGQEDLIMHELDAGGGRPFKAIKCGDVFEY